MTTRLKDLVPMLICGDVRESVRFYEDALGFTVVGRMDDVGKSGWASIRNGGAQLMLASPTYLPDGVKVDGRYPQVVYYFYPEDVEALRRRVVSAGYPAGDFAVRFYGMKEFEVLDPSGHVLVFGQETDEPMTPEAR